jgi:TonB-dependent receptor
MRQLSLTIVLTSSLACNLSLSSLARAQSEAPSAPAAAPEAPGSTPAEPPSKAPTKEAEADAAEAAPDDEGAKAEAAEPAAAEAAETEAAEAEAAEAELEGDASSFSKAPRKGMAVIWGVVKDGVEHDTLPEALVSIPGTQFKTIADFDGRFRLEVPPGTYNLRIYVELHRPSVIKNVSVVAGTVEKYEVEVLPDEAAVETVEVVTSADKASVEGQILTRQRSAAMGDGIGRAEISRTPATNAAQASTRIVGATIVGNRFVYVRGLGERYTNALLNGTPLPSPEPDRAAIPLDLFPALILDNVTIVKTFTPDVPADFAGGSVRIETRELPSKPLLQLSASLGYDTNSTFRSRLAQPPSSTDWLGYDSGLRKLPSGFPPYVLAPGQPKPGGGTINDEDLVSAGRSINSTMQPHTSTAPPNYSLGAVAGRGWSLGGEQRLGAMASLNYSRSFKVRNDITMRQFQPDVTIDENGERRRTETPTYNLKGQQGLDKVTWGALGSVSYWANQRHRMTLLGLHTQLADSSTQLVQGEYASRGASVASANLRYVSRALNVLQLRGEHDLPELNKAEVRWYLTYSTASRLEPNTRDTVYQFNDADVSWNGVTTPENGSHFYSNQTEKTRGGGLDFTQPVSKNPDELKLKAGGLVTRKTRDFAARRFTLGKARGAANDLFLCPGQEYQLSCPGPVYQYDNVGTTIDLTETTKPEDAYKAGLDIYAGYLMVDAKALRDVRVVGGVRVEHTDQSIDPYSQFSGGQAPAGAKIRSTDWLPALSLTYSATKTTKLRAAVSKTLARPQMRELAPFVFADFFGAYPISGNPQLKMTYIQNADLRFEWFPSVREVLAFSLFYKSFADPIEPYVIPSGTPGIISHQNAKGAKLEGVELEARKSLGFLTPKLVDLTFVGNLTLAHSRIQLDDQGGLTNSTNSSRPMVNQAPYVINLGLDYHNEAAGFDAGLLYNVIGPRIVQVGTGGLDDTYAQPMHLIDAMLAKEVVKHVTVKLTGTNLLNASVQETIGKSGRDDRVTLQYRDGRVFALSGTYTY